MDDPIKIIHKYKNNNGTIQYHIHIFLGDIVDENCMRILRKIKDIDFYIRLTSIDERERDILKKIMESFGMKNFLIVIILILLKIILLQNSAKLKN